MENIDAVITIAIFVIALIIKSNNKKLVVNNKILGKNGFSQIKQVKNGTKLEYCSAIKRGDNYLLQFIRIDNMPSISDINELAKLMKDMHYHNGIIICKARPFDRIQEHARINSIEIKTITELYRQAVDNRTIEKNAKKNDLSEEPIERFKEFDDESIRLNQTEEEPIRDFEKESLFKKLFKKPERL